MQLKIGSGAQREIRAGDIHHVTAGPFIWWWSELWGGRAARLPPRVSLGNVHTTSHHIHSSVLLVVTVPLLPRLGTSARAELEVQRLFSANRLS